MNPRLILPLLILIAPLCLLLALAVGSVPVDFSSLFDGSDALGRSLILELRLPRALSAFAAGGLLALAGALMQVLLRNPLADPYILGISGGAAVGALLSLLFGLGAGWMMGNAFLGAMITMLLVFGLAHGQGSWSPLRMLLTGVIVAAGWSATTSFILAIAPERNLHGMLFWIMGDLGYAPPPLWGLIVTAAGLLVCLPYARDLNVLARGELTAGALGVSVKHLRLFLYVVAGLLTATAVTIAGSVGFVGLVVPHLLRLLGLSDHRYLLPAAVLTGGSLLVLADTVARSILAPQQLPVGVITAMLGVPVFLYLLHRRRGSL
ncbi:MAG: iron ABC transporter permease [Ectothiorhodospiraceae bacterium]|nr:iron ABC transporter permease [Ectothiorhodospiraceae bacterium]